MSINTAVLTADFTLSLFRGEKLFSTNQGVKMSLECGGGYPGVGGSFYCQSGVLFLTNLRVVYVTKPPLQTLKSIDIPLGNIRNVKPYFGYKEITAIVKPVPSGGIPTVGQLKLTFTQDGAVEFHSYYLHVQSYHTAGEGSQQPQEQLPVYAPSAPSTDDTLPDYPE